MNIFDELAGYILRRAHEDYNAVLDYNTVEMVIELYNDYDDNVDKNSIVDTPLEEVEKIKELLNKGHSLPVDKVKVKWKLPVDREDIEVRWYSLEKIK